MPRSPHPNLPPLGGRILSLDLARGFTVLIMPSVHVVMLYSQLDVQQSLPGVILQFLAEGPGAQLFMLIMGVSITLSKTLTPKKVFKRTIYLLLGAFALNLFKFVIPLQLGFLPDQLLRDVPFTSLDFLLLGDIFHFAAIAFPICYMVSNLKPRWALFIAVAIMLLSPYTWDVKTNLVFVDQILAYFTGHPPQVFFPVFPWLVYPLLGIWISKSVQSKQVAIVGAGTIIISLLFPATTTIPDYPALYRTLPADTLFHAGLVLLWLSLFNYLAQKVKMNPGFRLLKFCSKNITLIYVLQWVLIFWCLPLAGYRTVGFGESLGWMCGMTLLILLLTKLLIHVPQSKNI